ncbi:hypothetical protein [Antrihabitans sp. YC2-6]|uniref:hypothetical protein n=1 Tax=Antrihabitans sp. YC2-6 TaxID=2799498 RepID=UPI001F160C93|nr:hypothetical protein [Antrihabitans sp. YC2-6]
MTDVMFADTQSDPIAASATHLRTLGIDAHPGFFDRRSQCRVRLCTPRRDPEMWRQYLDGALHSYQAYGVVSALEYDRIEDGASTTLFFVVEDSQGAIVGGVRCQGPYTFADEAHAVEEWEGCVGQDAVRQLVADRLDDGVVELKTGWVAPDAKNKSAISDVISRCILHATAIWNVKYAVGTGADHVLPLWRKSGGLPVEEIPAAAYPTDRYRTKLVWWDRETFADVADHGQVLTTLSEWMDLADSIGLPTDRFNVALAKL